MRRIAPTPSPIDFREVVKEHNSLVKTAEDKRNALQKLHDEASAMHLEATDAHNRFMATVEAKLRHLDGLIEQAKTIQKGDKGDNAPGPVAGVDYPIPKDGTSVDHDKVVADVLKKVPTPKDGNSPTVDYKKIIKAVLPLLPKPDKPKDGKAPTMKEIMDEIKKTLKVEHIPGLSNEIASYRSQLAGKAYGRDTLVRGGGDTVAAGSNITISNSNGVKTISSSGGSGFTELTATETPNGSTTVFTFAAAASQPSYVVSDNVWMKATSKAGTVNWTWNNGTKKATMTVPPVDDLYAIV